LDFVDEITSGKAVAALVDMPFDLYGIKKGLHVVDLPDRPVIHNTTLLATSDYIKANEETVNAFIKGFIEALHFFKTQPAKVVPILKNNLAKRYGLQDDEYYIHLQREWAKLLNGGPMFAVVCETLRAGPRPVRFERLGRPEIKNVTLSVKLFDPINRDLEIRDLYNSEDAFALTPDYVGAYRTRFNANLAFYDTLDGKIDWPLDQGGNHPLTQLLLHDFLVIDASKPFGEMSYFEIERALLAGRPHVTAGGRWLNEDLMDSLFTLYINGGNGPRINDGIAGPIAWSSKVFPYLAPPNPPTAAAR